MNPRLSRLHPYALAAGRPGLANYPTTYIRIAVGAARNECADAVDRIVQLAGSISGTQ